MALSKNLISDFVKATTDDKKTAEETTLYGTIVEYNGSKYVRLDGSDMLTPYTATVAAKAGEKVKLDLRDRKATKELPDHRDRLDLRDRLDPKGKLEVLV